MATKVNIDIICRCCLKEGGELVSIFHDDFVNIPFSEMISACSIAKVDSMDKLPKQICSQCIASVTASYNFKQQCERAYNTLFELIGYEIPTVDSNKRDCYVQTDEILFAMCEMCDAKFISEERLRMHRNEEHAEDDQFQCRECPKHYSRLNHLQRHIALVHPELSNNVKILKDNVCKVCNKVFTRSDHLKRHLENVHRENTHFFNLDTSNESDGEYEEHDEFEPIACDTELKTGEEDILQKDTTIECSIKSEQLENNSYEESKDMKIEGETSHTSVKEETSFNEAEEEQEEDNEDNDQKYNPDDDGGMDDIYDGEDNSDDEDYTITKPVKIKTEPTTNKPMKSFERTRPKRYRPKEEFSCTDCNLQFTVRPKYAKHMEEVHNISKIFKCQTCDKSFGRATHLRRHEITHLEVKPYKCDDCDKRFSRLDHLNLHRHHHSEVKPHICEICSKGFTRAEHLKKHREARHGNKEAPAKNNICEICKKGFSTEKYLQIHMRVHSQKSWTCKFCQEEFGSKKEMLEHSKSHNNERPYLCSECGLRFVRNDYLVIHMRRHKGEKPYKCKFCGKGFPRATDLTVHERYHTGEKTHLCTICGKGFQRAYNLLVHTRVHTGERPYECPHCNKRFAQGNDLKAHVRRHTGERYKCDICGDGFIQGYHLTQHKRTQHGIDMQSHIRRVEKFPTTGAQQDSAAMEHMQYLPNMESVYMAPGGGELKETIIKVEPQISILEPQYPEQNIHQQISHEPPSPHPQLLWSINPGVGQ